MPTETFGVSSRSPPSRAYAWPDVQFGDQLTDDEGDVLARRAVFDHRRVMITHPRPVDTVHVGIVEEVPLDSPGLQKQLSPFLARIDVGGHPVPFSAD